MNEMDMEYYVRYNAQYNKFRLYVKLELSVELNSAGTTVYMIVGFQNAYDNMKWDYLRFRVNFDGDGRMPINQFTVADLYSKNRAKDGCLD